MNQKFILDKATQVTVKCDDIKYLLQKGEVVIQITNRKIRDNNFRIESNNKIVQISKSIIESCFTKIKENI